MNIEKIRSDTPGTRHHIHFNNAGASLITSAVKEAIEEYQSYEFLHGGYETAERYKDELENGYEIVADFINAVSNEIAFVESATVAWQLAFSSIDFNPGEIILTSEQEYASNYIAYLQEKNKTGIRVQVIPSDDNGLIDLIKLQGMITPKVRLISLAHMPTNSGLVHPAEEIGEIARKNDILFLLDTCQSIGQYPIDVRELNCDFLTATGRKYLRAPRGTGFLFVKEALINGLEPMYLDLHGADWTQQSGYVPLADARRFEKFESNLANRMGLIKAVEYANQVGIENIWQRIQKISTIFRQTLSEVKGIRVTDMGTQKSGIVTFVHDQFDPDTIKKRLFAGGINVSVSGASTTYLDMKRRNLSAVVRASLNYYNTEEEIDKFIAVLKEIVS